MRGEVDMLAVPTFERSVREALDRGHRGLVVDLSEVTFLDSSLLSALIGALRRTRRRGAGLAVVCPRPSIRRIFELTGLDRVLRLTRDRAEALVLLGRPAPAPAG
jgi:anti-sigma B factor antagonist